MNVEEAIDKALENSVDYNFAIDLQGNFFHGKNTKPPKISSPSTTEEPVEVAVNT